MIICVFDARKMLIFLTTHHVVCHGTPRVLIATALLAPPIMHPSTIYTSADALWGVGGVTTIILLVELWAQLVTSNVNS
jgi:hypothetical protein